MRMYNEEQEVEKTIVTENYSTFKKLINSKWLFYMLIAYTAYTVINAVLAILDKGYVMAAINLVVHGLVCTSFWLFYINNKSNDETKFSTKGTNIFLLANALKYVIVFVLLITGFIMLCLAWSNTTNEFKQQIITLSNQINTEEQIAALKASLTQSNWKYIGIIVFYIAFALITLVYYYAVMSTVKGIQVYHDKGIHCWKQLKFTAIYLMVAAGFTVLCSILLMTGTLQNFLGYISKVDYTSMLGGFGIISNIGRFIAAILYLLMGIICLKGYKAMNSTVTSSEEVVKQKI